MKLEYFRYLLEIDRLHSISAAARTLHISQTTLSAIVKSVEVEAGYSVFHRTPAGVVATPKGENFLDMAWEISAKYADLSNIRKRTTASPQFISILISPVLAGGFSLPLASRLLQSELRTNLTFEERYSTDIPSRIVDNAAPIGLAYLSAQEFEHAMDSAEKRGLEIEKLFPDRLCLIVSCNHELANQESIELADVCSARILVLSQPHSRNSMFRNVPIHLKKTSALGNLDVIKQAVLTRSAMALLPGYSIYCDGRADTTNFHVIMIRGLNSDANINACIISRMQHKLRYQERVLVSCIRDYFREFPRTR